MSKKTILMASIVLVFLVGCQQQNLTWTPTAGEWTAMTPEQRGDWYRLEMEAREHKSRMWQQSLDNLDRAARRGREQETITIIPTQNSTYWQEQRARQEYGQKQLQGIRSAPLPLPAAGWWKKIK